MTHEEFKLARSRLGLTQAAMAQRLGVGLRTLQEWERGERRVSKQTKLAIKYLETKTDSE